MIHIDDIRWVRSFFELRYRSDGAEKLWLYRVKEHRFIPFEIEPLEADPSDSMAAREESIAGEQNPEKTYVARINIAIAGAREVLPSGQWIICTRIDGALLVDIDTLLAAKPHLRARIEGDLHRLLKIPPEESVDELLPTEGLSTIAENPYDTHGIIYSEEILDDLGRYSRVFRYGKNTYAYTINLIAKANFEGAVYVALEPEFFRRNKNPRVRKHSLIFTEKQVMSTLYGAISALFGWRRNGRRLLFFKQNGNGPTENMAALQRRLGERGLEKDYDIIHRYRNVFEGRQKPFAWIKDLYLIATSDYIFIDDYTPVFNFIDPPQGCVLTQIWHAGVGFKSVGYARFGLNASPDPYASGHRKYTYALVGNAGLRDIYSEVFGIEYAALLATGMPRLDHFLDEDVVEQSREDLYQRYPQLCNGRVIVFAPTFRGAGQRSAYYPYNVFDMDALYEMCERTNSYFIFEMHHFISEEPPIDERFSDRILNLSNESLNELLYITDVLVTDYSSCFYDFLLLKRPVVFFTPDREVYSATRGVQRPIKEMAPGTVCDTFQDFIDVLDKGSYQAVVPDPLTVDRASEGGMFASDRVIDTVLLGQDVPGVKLEADGS